MPDSCSMFLEQRAPTSWYLVILRPDSMRPNESDDRYRKREPQNAPHGQVNETWCRVHIVPSAVFVLRCRISFVYPSCPNRNPMSKGTVPPMQPAYNIQTLRYAFDENKVRVMERGDCCRASRCWLDGSAGVTIPVCMTKPAPRKLA
jgi:hypothetical protein